MDFGNLASAYKRAKHFGSIQFVGPFSVIAKTGPAIAARNYCMLLDANDGVTSTEEFVVDLVLLNGWARSINRYCDNNMIANDELAKEAFACFASRLPIDPLKL